MATRLLRVKQVASTALRSRRPLCNARPHTAIRILNWELPLCARCCGVVGGSITAATLTPVLAGTWQPPLSLVAVACFACASDGIISYRRPEATNNFVRFVTGYALGSSLTLWIG
ncbi:DUF2085 domain-containing protein [Aureimonas endophytica]|uniref:DUF2085 domain-containing protein n=1 Tax=Aureimonas endophytica TaxID=2027858 RepID=UPI003570D0A4